MIDTMYIILGLVAFLCYREWFHSKEIEKLEDRYFNERRDLLDRLMSENFTQYKQAVVMEKEPIADTLASREEFDYSIIGNELRR